MKIAAQLYTVHDFLGTKKDMEMTFKKVKEMGYDYIQLSGAGYIDDEKADFINELIKIYGLKICVTHMSYEQLNDELESLIKYHKMWNCQYIGIGAMPEQYRNKENINEFIEWANKIGKKVSDEGLTFTYHNHRFEFEKVDGKTFMEIMAEGFNDSVQILLDTYWVQSGGADPVSWIDKLKGKVDVVHFKDYGIKDNQEYFAEIGSGNFDWYKIIEACNRAGVKYAAIERDSGEIEAFESLAISRNYLKEVHGL
ncbi:sugar phosphate isomerase [Vallitalea longa]|uniref:Sugar phosphate isomerase n=1 Tax=Vallitalea longa TaxID=2936439 RepID=A0A9W6DER2_9FIRM|nr:sugar phosphate isomerase/epimerase [Vallitalea longa]GKX29790.1 sugar phosphate isomerase [Vallitalea longa]